jgi:hypothetical protein
MRAAAIASLVDPVVQPNLLCGVSELVNAGLRREEDRPSSLSD